MATWGTLERCVEYARAYVEWLDDPCDGYPWHWADLVDSVGALHHEWDDSRCAEFARLLCRIVRIG